MTLRIALGLVLALGACREPSGDPARRVTHTVVAPAPPCAGCLVDVPAQRTGVLPLLVVLHGNHEEARDAAERWSPTAVARGWVVLALTCPRDQGCDDGKWYRWRATPTWVKQQVATLARALPIDPARTFLAGWSGGASAIGMHMPAWDPTFAAVVFHGGGQPPLGDDACPARVVPGYFLVGDANPAHRAAQRLRDYYQSCDIPLAWDLLPGANHAREDAALDHARTTAILDWLEAHARKTIPREAVPREAVPETISSAPTQSRT